MPRSIKHTINRKENWLLDAHRKIIYIQNHEQKKNVIYSLTSNNFYNDKIPNREELREINWKICKNNPEKFVDWFKENYPNVYLEIF